MSIATISEVPIIENIVNNSQIMTINQEVNNDNSQIMTINQEVNNDNSLSGINRLKYDPGSSYFSYSDLDKIYNNINKGNIIINGNEENSSNKLKIELKSHQKRILYEMLKKEEINYRVSSGINAFVLADKVGSGKSIDVLALICKKPILSNYISNNSIYKPNLYSNFKGFTIEPTVNIKSNVIIVPHGIYNQWLDYINNYSSLIVLSIKSKIDIDKLEKKNIEELASDNNNYDIILIKSTKYKDFMKCIYNVFPYSTVIKNNICKIYNNLKKNLQNIKKLSSSSSYFNDINYNLIQNIKSIKDIINKIDITELENDLNKNDKFPIDYIKYYSGPVFERVFIDEANSIKIPGMLPIIGKINWFITSSLQDLFYPNGKSCIYSSKKLIDGIKGTGFIKNVFRENSSKNLLNFLQDIYIKNNDDFIYNSFNLPEYIENKIPCFTPAEIKILNGVAVPEIMNALNAGDIESAIKFTGCETNSKDTIVDKVLFNLNNTLEKKTNILTSKYILLENFNNTVENEENKIKKKNLLKSIKLYDDSITKLKHKINCVTSRLNNTENKDCPVCTQTINNDCITPCCNNRFCFECIVTSLNYSKQQLCPICRTPIQYNQLITVQEKINNSSEKLPTKLENILKIISNNPTGKYLIFSEFDNTITNILSEFTKNNISYQKLYGSAGYINNTIQKYVKGEINVLLLNAKHFGSGLNLEMTSDVIIYHRMSKDLETQIIGRAQRPGRTTSLKVHYLCYENEI